MRSSKLPAQRINNADLAPIKRWLDPMVARVALADWARSKFAITVDADELAHLERKELQDLLSGRVREAYRQREIRYPVEYILQTTIGQAAQGQMPDAYAIERLRQWVKGKFNIDWTDEDVSSRNGQQLYDTLVKLNTEYLTDGKLAEEIDRQLHQLRQEWLTWAQQRFGPHFKEEAVDGEDASSVLQRAGREMLRHELTMLEQVVLLRIYDQAWQGHLYAMDRLKEGIGLRGYAERDPKIEYKREGFRMFQEMMGSIRENVTDIIFKVQMVDESSARSVYRVSQTQHADATGAGLSAPTLEQQGALQAQGGQPVAQPIRREVARVGRNDPCPCGSGKKYKKCHGKNLA